MPLITTEEKLQERIKELSCLYNMSSVFLSNQAPGDAFEQVCAIVRSAWRYPENAIVHLTLDDFTVYTDELPAQTIMQQSQLVIEGEVRGQISVHYDAAIHAAGAFLEDEQQLLRKVAFEISAFYERHLKDNEIAMLKRRAERSDRLAILGEITAGIAHELNTPLGNILGFAELIAARTADQQTLQDISKVIKGAIYSREIVKKLMFFSCEMPQHRQLTKIEPVAVQALTLLEPNFRKAQVAYSLDIADPNIEAQIDPIQFTQVLFNILVNAIYVSPPESSISTRIYNDDQNLFVEVSDEGPGILEDHRNKIFEPFFTTKPFGEGNGLGLSVVHGIIKGHLGEISTFDNSPAGTVFKIRLPLKH